MRQGILARQIVYIYGARGGKNESKYRNKGTEVIFETVFWVEENFADIHRDLQDW